MEFFTADVFQADYAYKHQFQHFLGVVAHHQNAHAEHVIQTIMYMARTFVIHVSFHWSEYGIGDLALWLFAVKHAT